MSTTWWVIIVAVLIVAVIVGVVRSRQTQSGQAQGRRVTAQREAGAQSPAEEISQREDRRLGGMSADDRAWEQASLERNRAQETRIGDAFERDA